MSEDRREIVWTEGTDRLARDPDFGPVVEEVGPVRLRPASEGHFAYLSRTIVYQQLAGQAAATIHGRFVDALGGEITPEGVLRASEESFRGAGVSRSKEKAIRDLAEKVRSGDLRLDDLEEAGNDEVAERLTTVWGIGRWTADMFLLFQLRRPDVWPVGDLGVRQGYARIHDLEEVPSAVELEPRGEDYRPWRSAAAWYCWRAVDVLPPEE